MTQLNWRKEPNFTTSPTEGKSVYPIEYPHGASSLIAVGPPVLPTTAATVDLYPVGLSDFVSIDIASGELHAPIIEIGSYHIHFMPTGVPIYGGQIRKIISARTSLLKSLYSYYLKWDDVNEEYTNELDPDKFPPGYMPDVDALPPNSAGYFYNAYSSLFRYPFGLYIAYQNLVEAPISAAVPGGPGMTIMQLYAERCYLRYYSPIVNMQSGQVIINQTASFFIGFLRALYTRPYPPFDDRKLMGL